MKRLLCMLVFFHVVFGILWLWHLSEKAIEKAWNHFCFISYCGFSGLPVYVDKYKKSTPIGANLKHLFSHIRKCPVFSRENKSLKLKWLIYLYRCYYSLFFVIVGVHYWFFEAKILFFSWCFLSLFFILPSLVRKRNGNCCWQTQFLNDRRIVFKFGGCHPPNLIPFYPYRNNVRKQKHLLQA